MADTPPTSLCDSAGQFARSPFWMMLQQEVFAMAKGQVRSNKEVRKPKKDKSAAAKPVASPFGSQVKDTGKPAPKGK
jgi:hypothetical protein